MYKGRHHLSSQMKNDPTCSVVFNSYHRLHNQNQQHFRMQQMHSVQMNCWSMQLLPGHFVHLTTVEVPRLTSRWWSKAVDAVMIV